MLFLHADFFIDRQEPDDRVVQSGGRSSMVELQPSKLIAWVRFPSPAHPLNKRHRTVPFIFSLNQVYPNLYKSYELTHSEFHYDGAQQTLHLFPCCPTMNAFRLP